MKKNTLQFTHVIAFTIIMCLLYAQLIVWQTPYVGVLYGASYLVLLTLWWRDILHHLFRFEKGFVSVLLSVFAVLFFVSSIEAIVLALYTTTPMLTFASLVCGGVATYVLRIAFLQKPHGSKIVGKGRKQYLEVFPRVTWMTWLYMGLWICVFILFFNRHDIDVLVSPWQVLHSWILPLMFILTCLLGFILFSKQKTTHILVLILMHSFLLHLYLPLSHTLPWGGDVWRHVAVEEQLAAGEVVLPVLFGPEAKWREVAGVDIPEAFLIPQKYTYGQFWSMAVIIHQTTGISLEVINIWLLPILWSLIFPLILFRIGRILFRSWRGGLLLAWLACFVFPLQVLGALTLPVSLGVLYFFFVFMLWLQYLGKRHHVQRWLMVLMISLMLFGYALAFLLMLFVVGGSWLLQRISNSTRSFWIGWALVGAISLLGISAIPTLEVVSGISHFPENYSFIEQTKQITGQFFGWYYASDIRPHDIASGNLFFNHTPQYAYVSNIFTIWRWWIIPAMIAFWGSILFGLYRFVRTRQPLRMLVPAWIFIVLIGAYKIGWFFLEGDRLFTRRLDPFISTFSLIFFSISLLMCFYYLRFKSLFLRRGIAVVLLCSVSWFGVSTYASGPDMRTVNVDEYAVATYVIDEESEYMNTCVLADTWILLPLEGLSAGRIVGGNFPIAYQFGQKERVSLYDNFSQGEMTTSTIEAMFAITNKTACYGILPADTISEEQEANITRFSVESPIRYSGFIIWKFELSRL